MKEMKHTIAEIVKGNAAMFSHYRASVMYYSVSVDESKYTFPVYLEDLEGAELHAEEKAIMLMRYIRKAIKDGTLISS